MLPLEEQLQALRQRRAALIEDADNLHNEAEEEERVLTDEEQRQVNQWLDEADELKEEIDVGEQRLKRRLRVREEREELERSAGRYTRTPPAVINGPRGDNEENALAAFYRDGDMGAVRHLQNGENSIRLGLSDDEWAQRASNDTTMNITTDADGGFTVPTGHFNGIIARRDEGMITQRLGVRQIPGVGTTVNVPIDNEDDGEFVSTAESAEYDRDAPAIGQKQFTLEKFTKKVDLTVELLEDEASRLLPFIEDFVGRGMAKSHNNLLLTEVAANGGTLQTFASATAIAVDELEPIIYDDDLEAYLEDMPSVAWVMRRSVHGEIVLLDDANVRRYANNQQGNEDGPSLLGFPVVYSVKAGQTVASATSVYFGNWNFVGIYESPNFSVIRDPFTRADFGEVRFTYMFRVDYGVLQSEAIGFGDHPSA